MKKTLEIIMAISKPFESCNQHKMDQQAIYLKKSSFIPNLNN